MEQSYLFYVTGNNNYQRMLGHNGFAASLFQGAAPGADTPARPTGHVNG